MPVQSQKKPEQKNPFSQDWEEKKKQSSQQSQKVAASADVGLKKFLMILGGVTACMISMLAGVSFRNENTLFLENRTMEGYLAPEDYILVDKTTGQPAQKVRSMHLKPMHSWDGNGMITNRGIGEGSTWQDVLDAYGDVHITSVTYYQNYIDNYSVDYSDALHVRESILLADFDREYVQTGQCDPERDKIFLHFELYHDGRHLYYSEKELNEAIDRYYDNPFHFDPVTPYPRDNDFELSFSLVPEEGVEYVATYYY